MLHNSLFALKHTLHMPDDHTAAAHRRVAALARQFAPEGAAPACPPAAPRPVVSPSPTAAPDPPAEAATCPRTAGGPFRPDRLLEGQVCGERERERERQERERQARVFLSIPNPPLSTCPPFIHPSTLHPSIPHQVAIITGAGQGLGAAAARLFAVHGAAVLVADLDGGKAAGVVADIKAGGGKAASFAGTSRTRPSRPRACGPPWTPLAGDPSTSWSTMRVREKERERERE